MQHTSDLLMKKFNIDERVLKLIDESETEISAQFKSLDDIMAYNQYKILDAFQKNNLSDMHFNWNTGYGYDDPGREALEKVYADIFHTDAALVRTNIVNGTHALAITLKIIGLSDFLQLESVGIISTLPSE